MADLPLGADPGTLPRCGERCASRREFLAAALALTVLPALRVMGDEAVFPIPSGDGASLDRDRGVIIVRHQGEVRALVLWCPHQHTPLRWQDADGRFECPKHHSSFQADGTRIEGRAERGMDRYAVRREGNDLVVDLGTIYREDQEAAQWQAAVVRL